MFVVKHLLPTPEKGYNCRPGFDLHRNLALGAGVPRAHGSIWRWAYGSSMWRWAHGSSLSR